MKSPQLHHTPPCLWRVVTTVITGLSACALLITGTPIQPLYAEPEVAMIHITTTADELNTDGDCSLREAVEAANLNLPVSGCPAGTGINDQLILPAGIYTLTLPGGLRFTESAVLKGAGANSTFIDGGGGSARTVLTVDYRELFVCDTTNDRVLRYGTQGGFNGVYIAAGSGGLDNPGALLPGGYSSISQYVYVAGYTSGIKRYNRDTGAYIDTLSVAGAPAAFGPTDIAFGNDFNLYATNYVLDQGGFWRFSPTAGYLSVFASTPYLPSSIVFGTNDDLFATDPTNNRVVRYNGDTGALIGNFATSNLNQPRGLVFGPDNHLYVANENSNTIVKFNGATGAFMSTFVAAGSGGLDKPNDLVFGPDGNLYVISKGTASVLRYNGQTGAFIDVFIEAGEGGIGLPTCLQWMGGVGTGPRLTLSDATVQRGSTGIFVAHKAGLTVRRSVITNNSGGFGGGIATAGDADIFDTTISNNNSFNFGGGIYNTGILDVNGSTLNGNFAPNGGGGVVNNGADAVLRMNNSTVSGNNTNRAGGGIFSSGQAILNNITIAFNNADSTDSAGDYGGGGVWNESGTFTLRNTIIAKNTDYPAGIAGEAPDCGGATLTSSRHNLIGNTLSCTIDDPDVAGLPFDQIGTSGTPIDPRLNPLAMDGGWTATHALQSTSPAINQGDTAVNNAPAFSYACRTADQRTFLRPAQGRCDVGAYEYSALPPPVAFLPLLSK